MASSYYPIEDVTKNMGLNEEISAKMKMILKHTEENVFSPGDLGRFLDRLRVEGLNPKAVILDYIDNMRPEFAKGSFALSDYDSHGLIVQELRVLSRQHKIPIITATQNNKQSENLTNFVSNRDIG